MFVWGVKHPAPMCVLDDLCGNIRCRDSPQVDQPWVGKHAVLGDGQGGTCETNRTMMNHVYPCVIDIDLQVDRKVYPHS